MGRAANLELRAPNDWPEGEAIHPNDVMRFSERQYAEREVWNSRGSSFNRVPEPFDPERIVDWTPVWSLTEERHKYLPTQLLYYRAPARDGDEAVYSIGCSNGNASGNTLAEALLQGFFELVERDAVALWWYNMLSRPGVDAESFGDPWIVKLAAHYRDDGTPEETAEGGAESNSVLSLIPSMFVPKRRSSPRRKE